MTSVKFIKIILLSISLLADGGGVMAYVTDNSFAVHSTGGLKIRDAVVDHTSIFTVPLALAWSNPALQSLRFQASLTGVHVGANAADDYRGGSFYATTWLDSERANITGYAGYENGKFTKGVTYETDDVDLTGPYLMYADGPDTLDKEVYRFGGSYMARLGKWSVGMAAGYNASLSYRTVDPRPKNVSGNLDINPAASLSLGQRFLLGLSIRFQRYRQTNDLKFVSELGSTTVYHLTGLGTTYARFDGTGTSTYYTGHSWGTGLGIMPIESGFFLATDFSSMRMANILKDFNNLPLAKTTTPRISGITGWKNRNWIVGMEGCYERRRGTENIFGDAVSGQYPLIGSLTLYSRTVRQLGLTATMRHNATVVGLDAVWHSRFEQHMAPLRKMEWQRIAVTARAQQQILLGRSGYLGLQTDLTFSCPTIHSISGVATDLRELQGAIEAIRQLYDAHTRSRLYGAFGAEAMFPVRGKFMLGATAGWRHTIEGVEGLALGVGLMF